MSLKPDWKYNGKVAEGSQMIETARGSIGFQVNLDCEDGKTTFVIWMTEKNRKRAEGSFDVLGADFSKLGSPSYLEYEFPSEIVGREVSFGTKEEEYNGKKSVKVAWIGKKSEGKPSVAGAKFFGAEPVIKDEDIPF